MIHHCKEHGCPQTVAEENIYCSKCLIAGQQYTGPQDSPEEYPETKEKRTICVRCKKDGLALAPTGFCVDCSALEDLAESESVQGAKPVRTCVHCGRSKKIAARGLCWRCYNDDLIKKNYPASATNNPRTTVAKRKSKTTHEVIMMEDPGVIKLSDDLDKAITRIAALEKELGRLSYSLVENSIKDEMSVGGALVIYIEDARDLEVMNNADEIAKGTRRDLASWILCLVEDAINPPRG